MTKYGEDTIEHFKARQIGKNIADITIVLFLFYAVFEAGVTYGLFQ